MRFLDKYFRKFFKHRITKWFVAHVCLFIASSIVLSDTLFILNELEVIHYSHNAFILGLDFFNSGYGLLAVLGYYIFNMNFCNWSKDSFYLILIYSVSHTIHSRVIEFSLQAELVLNAILLYLSVLIVKNLIEESIKRDIDKKIRLM